MACDLIKRQILKDKSLHFNSKVALKNIGITVISFGDIESSWFPQVRKKTEISHNDQRCMYPNGRESSSNHV